MKENTEMTQVLQEIIRLKLIEQKYDILVGYIQQKAEDGYINTEKMLKFIDLLNKGGAENE